MNDFSIPTKYSPNAPRRSRTLCLYRKHDTMIDWDNTDEYDIAALGFLLTSLANERVTCGHSEKARRLATQIGQKIHDLETRPRAGITYEFGPSLKR